MDYLAALNGYLPIYRKYQSQTMIPEQSYLENLLLVGSALQNPDLSKGAIVECGTWKGGMAAGLIEIGGQDRDYCFFDSFEGMPAAKEIDGENALRWQADKASPKYYDNCSASLEEFQATVNLAGCAPERIKIFKGLFEKTLPDFQPPLIAVLRLDADWYDSTMICLQKFWNHILPGGLILLDDYYVWDGCSRAVHSFLAERQATERIHQFPVGVAFMRKNKLTARSAQYFSLQP
jgi:hypothetical protein